MTPLDTRPYEPWTPRVGQRVRYLWQPECPGVYGLRAPVGHPPDLDSQAGVVYGRVDDGIHTSHPYLVAVGQSRRKVMAAAIELAPLDDDDVARALELLRRPRSARPLPPPRVATP